MLNLDSDRWVELSHAYGIAGDIPGLLHQLNSLPSFEGDSEPWFTLWSALAHQGDVYSASFAAVPHVIEALASAPRKADFSYFQFPAWIEICRVKTQFQVPVDLRSAYFKALDRLPELAATALSRESSSEFVASAMAAIAAAIGQAEVAEAILEMNSAELAKEYLEWFHER